jgi:NAD dependent epimerase/dehydratase family enzyme
MRALVTGATGFVGRRLLQSLQRPVVLSRDPERARAALGSGVEVFAWNPEAGPAPAEAFQDVDAVFHLAGEPIAGGRWTPERKARIVDSRVVGTRHLVQGLEGLSRPPAVLVSASAVG